jgi:hypothetical protein
VFSRDAPGGVYPERETRVAATELRHCLPAKADIAAAVSEVEKPPFFGHVMAFQWTVQRFCEGLPVLPPREPFPFVHTSILNRIDTFNTFAGD